MPVAGLHGLPTLGVHTSPLFLSGEIFSHIIRYAFSIGNAGLRHKQFVPESVEFEPEGQVYGGAVCRMHSWVAPCRAYPVGQVFTGNRSKVLWKGAPLRIVVQEHLGPAITPLKVQGGEKRFALK